MSDVWGIQPPTEKSIKWGCRAIYGLRDVQESYRRKSKGRFKTFYRSVTVADIDCVWDRQALHGGTEDERKAMIDFFNKKGMPRLKKECVERYVTSDCSDVISFDTDGYHVEASPRSSCGYLYIGVWPI